MGGKEYKCKICGAIINMAPDGTIIDSHGWLATGGSIDLYRHIKEVHGLPHMPRDYEGDWDDFISIEVIPQYFDL